MNTQRLGVLPKWCTRVLHYPCSNALYALVGVYVLASSDSSCFVVCKSLMRLTPFCTSADSERGHGSKEPSIQRCWERKRGQAKRDGSVEHLLP